VKRLLNLTWILKYKNLLWLTNFMMHVSNI
jgi:hypothetical protein